MEPSQEPAINPVLNWLKPAFWRFCIQRMREHDVLNMSAALTFRAVFAMIPVVILALLVAKAIGTLEDSKRSLRAVLEASGFAQIVAVQEDEESGDQPTTAPIVTSQKVINVADEIERIVNRVERKLTFARVGPIGGLLLIWTALSLMGSVEQSLGLILGARRNRTWGRRMLLYWSAMTLGPVLLAVLTFVASRGAEALHRTAGLAWLFALLAWIGPLVIGVFVLAAFYQFLPNTSVRSSAALAGAAVAVVLWSVAKWGFAAYVQRLVLRGNLYGVLGALPLFLLWVYYSWAAFLLGAELAYAGSQSPDVYSTPNPSSMLMPGPSDFLAALASIHSAYNSGSGPVHACELAGTLKLPIGSLQQILDRLKEADLLCVVPGEDEPSYTPKRPPELTSVLAVIDVADPRRSFLGEHGQDVITNAVTGLRAKFEGSLKEMTIADLIKDAKNADGPRQSTQT